MAPKFLRNAVLEPSRMDDRIVKTDLVSPDSEIAVFRAARYSRRQARSRLYFRRAVHIFDRTALALAVDDHLLSSSGARIDAYESMGWRRSRFGKLFSFTGRRRFNVQLVSSAAAVYANRIL